jgi:hypothetical protein
MRISQEAPFRKTALTPAEGHASSPSPMPAADLIRIGIKINWLAGKAETVEIRNDDAAVLGKADRISLRQGSPAPLRLEARARTINFRREELERTHWKKVCRLMQSD